MPRASVGEPPGKPCIYVLAGTNGAGKSSIAGAMFRKAGIEYFNPDAATQRFLASLPGMSLQDANIAAWQTGKRLLETAIANRLNFAFETTLGGSTIAALLAKALTLEMEVRMWYVGLSSPELHLARVRARVRRGGHDISEAKIRERFDRSRTNLVRLLARLTELLLYDNSRDADPAEGIPPEPLLILHVKRGKLIGSCDLGAVPHWAKPIVLAATKL